jgi:hypothetical protein
MESRPIGCRYRSGMLELWQAYIIAPPAAGTQGEEHLSAR